MPRYSLKQRLIVLGFKVLMPLVRIYWFVFRPRVTGVLCLVRNGRDILMIRQTYGDRAWGFPGGGVKRGEGPEEAVKREVAEEVGLAIAAPALLGEVHVTYQYVKSDVTIFAAETPSRDLKLQALEVLEGQWFDIDSLPPLSPRLRPVEPFIGKLRSENGA